MIEDRWDVGVVVCIKPYKTLKVGYRYDIKGRGNLEFNADPEVGDRIGYGLCVEDGHFGDWKLPYAQRIKWYYFTIPEMEEYFITENEDYKIYLRDQKLNEVIN